MSDEELTQRESDPETVITEEPAAPSPVSAPKQWKMPEPIFRKTSGYLPKGYEKRYGPVKKADVAEPSAQPEDVDFGSITMVGSVLPRPQSEQPAPAQPTAEPLAAASISAAAAAVEPQPDIAESFLLDDLESEPPTAVPKRRGGTFRILMLILGLLAIFVFAAVFLAVVYILFFAPQSDSGNF